MRGKDLKGARKWDGGRTSGGNEAGILAANGAVDDSWEEAGGIRQAASISAAPGAGAAGTRLGRSKTTQGAASRPLGVCIGEVTPRSVGGACRGFAFPPRPFRREHNATVA